MFRRFAARFGNLGPALVLAVIVLSAITPGSSADDATPEIAIRAGIEKCVKVRRWAPVRVEVRAVEASAVQTVVVEALDPHGNSVRFPLQRTTSNAPHAVFHGRFQSGQLGDVPRVTVQLSDGTVLSRRLKPTGRSPWAWSSEAEIVGPLRQSVFLIASLGRPAGFGMSGVGTSKNGAKAKKKSERTGGKPIRVLEPSVSDFPADLRGLDALNVVVISGEYPLNSRQDAALRAWVREGGHLVLCRGSDLDVFIARTDRHAAELAAGIPFVAAGDGNRSATTGKPKLGDALLAEWLPVTILGRTRLRDLNSLESYSGRKSPIIFAGRIPAARIADPEQRRDGAGRVLAAGRSGPLIVQVPYGMGQITFCGLDFHRPPISTWRDADALGEKILEQTLAPVLGEQQGGSVRISQSGRSDLGTQLHAIQEHFPAVRRLSAWKTIGLLLLYVLLIGPLDYLLVHRVLKRPRLTWLTLPVMVTAATWVSVRNAKELNGTSLRLNRFQVMDIDAATTPAGSTAESGQFIHVTSWDTLYSPDSRRYFVRMKPSVGIGPVTPEQQSGNSSSRTAPGSQPKAHGSQPNAHGSQPKAHGSQPVGLSWPAVSWSGINENVFGGMYRSGGVRIGSLNYTLQPESLSVEGLPIPLWSTKTLKSEWRTESSGLIESRLIHRDNRLTGRFRHHLSAPIEDWVIVHKDKLYRPVGDGDAGPSIASGTWYPLTADALQQAQLTDVLTKTRFSKELKGGTKAKETMTIEQTPYDPSAKDPTEFVRTVSFHQAVGGRRYTKLHNFSLARKDLSHLLGMNRAILIGRIRSPVSQVLSSNREESESEVVSPTRSATFVRIVLPVFLPSSSE